MKIRDRHVAVLLIALHKINDEALSNLIDEYNNARSEGKDFSDIVYTDLRKIFGYYLEWAEYNGKISGGLLSPRIYAVLRMDQQILEIGICDVNKIYMSDWIKRYKSGMLDLSIDLLIPILAKVLIDSAVRSGFSEELVFSTVFEDKDDPSQQCFSDDDKLWLRSIKDEKTCLIRSSGKSFVSWKELVSRMKITFSRFSGLQIDQ